MKFFAEKVLAIESFCDFVQSNGQSRPTAPLEINFEISNLCNFQCAMCAPFSKLNPRRHLDLRTEHRRFQDFDLEPLDAILQSALMVHCFGYGEVTIHPRFFNIVRSLAEYEVLIDFFTNGQEMDESLSRLLVEGNVAKIVFSFSGVDKTAYENVYMGGDFARVLKNIEVLAQLRKAANSRFPRLEINSLGFQHHIDHLPEFVDMMADIGVDAISVKPLEGYEHIPQLHRHIAVCRPEREGLRIAEAHRRAEQHGLRLNTQPFVGATTVHNEQERQATLSRLLGGKPGDKEFVPISDLRDKGEQVVQLKSTSKPGREKLLTTALDIEASEMEQFLQSEVVEPSRGVPCLEPFMRFYIKNDGTVKPCCFGDRGGSPGNINRHSASEIWHGVGFETIQQGILQNRYPMSLCGHCLSRQQYPMSHFLANKVNLYANWVADCHGEAFPPALLTRAKALNKNIDITL